MKCSKENYNGKSCTPMHPHILLPNVQNKKFVLWGLDKILLEKFDFGL